MSQAPRRINTQRSLNRPTEQRPTEAPLKGQPDFFQEEPSVPHVEQRTRPAAPASHGGNGGNGTPPRGGAHAAPSQPPRRRSKAKKKKKTPMWLPLAVTLAVVAVISGVVVYAASMVNKVEENIKPEENAASLVEEIQTLEEYKGDVVNILVCGIDYEEGRAYSSDGTNDGMTDMILYCQFDIKGGALRMLQIPRNSLVATKGRKVNLSNGKTYAVSNYQINSVALSNDGNIAALAEVIYDQYKLPIDYYVTIDMQALVEMVDNFGGIEVYIPHDMSFAGSALKQGYRNLDGSAAEFFVRCRHGEGYSNSDIDRLNMQRYFYAGLFKRVRSMGITDVLSQLDLVFSNYIHTDMDLTTIAKMLVSFTRIDSANIMLAQTPVFMGVPNVGKTDSFDGYSCVVPDAGSIAELLNTYFRNYTGPVSAEELNLVTNDWPHGTASTSANVQFVGQLDKESDDAILSGDTDVAGATTTTDGQAAGQ
ncbi:LCP family protein [Faecalibacterium prausnitzii]|uniref:Transcriptional regulator n=1 Tax=Faecalibacterium prausnitzii TaxID=853 RepID=A0A2A7AU87_9FIRM|nr:LCP family protein [Faecalibacterium prausnitzii]PDX82673.1 transcriptional regulator [Faecalibacterium prausnitzii]